MKKAKREISEKNVPWATLLVAALALAAWGWPQAEARLLFERDLIGRGEWWRVVTGHWVHFGASHLVWNLAVLVPAGIWLERLAPGRARRLLLLAPVVIGLALFAFDPALMRYGGLSGIAAAVLALLALTQLAAGAADRWFWRGVLLVLALKIGVELAVARPLFARLAEPGIHAVPLAHLAGVGGAIGVHFTRRGGRRVK